MDDFIKKNKSLWSNLPQMNSSGKILIEEPLYTVINHILAIFSIIINQSQSLTPTWLYTPKINIDLFKSYVSVADFVKPPKFNLMQELKMAFSAFAEFKRARLTGDILGIKYDGVKYGDIIYDTYLAENHVATIKKIDFRIYYIIYKCIRRHEKICKILQKDNYKAVLVSHRIGLQSGVMMRTALRYGYDAYSTAGQHMATLMHSKGLDQAISYEYKPNQTDIDLLVNLPDKEFDKYFEKVTEIHKNGQVSLDSKYAFLKKSKTFKDKFTFCREYNLDPKKRNIFIMLHAFTDHPHSHFKWMLFKDYYDWFINTLEFAKKNREVNWIFKQHPSIKFYPTKDVSFSDLFSKVPKNVKYISENNQINTNNVGILADAVITCIGSAGFEIPAKFGIPCIVGGENYYCDLSFTINPKTKKDYFLVLKNASNIKRLTYDQQKIAKAVYMYVYYFSRVKMNAIPLLSLEDQGIKNDARWYWNNLCSLYIKEKKYILKEIAEYSMKVSYPGFSKLNTKINDLK